MAFLSLILPEMCLFKVPLMRLSAKCPGQFVAAVGVPNFHCLPLLGKNGEALKLPPFEKSPGDGPHCEGNAAGSLVRRGGFPAPQLQILPGAILPGIYQFNCSPEFI
jgi:hypothetical protein